MKGGVYVYWTRKPGARYNIPVLSRHVGYVGQTSSFWHRHRQHMGLGGLMVLSNPRSEKPWADLDPVCYRISLPNVRWLRLMVEALLIWTLFPVYNVQLNRHNPRRIKPWTAQEQRRLRNRGRRPFNFTRAHAWTLGAALGAALWLLGHLGGTW